MLLVMRCYFFVWLATCQKWPGQEGVGFRLLVVPNRDFSHSFWWYRHLWLVLQMVAVLLSECKKLLKTRMMMKGSLIN